MASPKTIIITGATGFLGSHLTHHLYQNNRIVILKRSFSNTRRIKSILNDLVQYNIDQVPLREIFEAEPIDIIIHTAACYGRNQETDLSVVEANLLFPLKLLDMAVRHQIDGFINTDTTADRCLNAYSLSKNQFSEWFRQSTEKIHKINIKLEHMYGPGDQGDRFITFLIREMLRHRPLDLTCGKQKRDFVYIDDVLNAFFTILKSMDQLKDDFNEFEVGSGSSYEIKKVVSLIKNLTHSRSRLNFGAIPYRENEMMDSKADISKLVELGWKPSMNIRKGLSSTITQETFYLDHNEMEN